MVPTASNRRDGVSFATCRYRGVRSVPGRKVPICHAQQEAESGVELL